MSKVACNLCEMTFTNQASLFRHMNLKRCPVLKKEELEKKKIESSLVITLSKKLEDLVQKMNDKDNLFAQKMNDSDKAIEKLTELVSKTNLQIPTTNIFNQNLQVMCVNPDDNFLDTLTARSNAQEALNFIKDCALSRLAGDCRLLEKVYFSTLGIRPPIMVMNNTRTRFVYYNENNQKVLETNPKVLARKLADCLQRTYLKGINLFRTDVSDSDSLKKDRLESYDVEDWNEHIHDLSDEKYQKKILDRLKIPNVIDI